MATSSLAFSVARSFSLECTQEHCSRMPTNSNMKGFSPTSFKVSWNRISCVRGVQEATTTRLIPLSSTAALIFSWVSWEQV